MEILLYNDQIDNCTFNKWDSDNYEFLDKFNDKVKNYLKNKIYANNNFIIDKNKDNYKDKCMNLPITSLDNYIDIMYFIKNPPIFLRMYDTKYYPEYIKLMDEYYMNLNIIR